MIDFFKKRLYLTCLFGGLMMSMSLCYGSMSSTNYKIDADVIGVTGNVSSSASYTLGDTLGEPIIGITSSGNYADQQGFWHMINTSMALLIDSNTVDLGTITPGIPVTGSSTITITTDAWGGYELYADQNHQLTHTDALTTIENYSCAISAPCAWSGTGLGFTLESGTDVDAKWGTNPDFNYAYFETSSTKIHETSSFISGGDVTVIGYKVDTPSTQKSGDYSNNITYLAISKL